VGRLVMGYWDCSYCGKKAIKGSLRECPGCGTARNKDTKFYMNPSKIEYVSETVSTDRSTYAHEHTEIPNRNPNWICKYCDTLNTSLATRCASCGSARTEKNRTYSNFNHVPLTSDFPYSTPYSETKSSDYLESTASAISSQKSTDFDRKIHIPAKSTRNIPEKEPYSTIQPPKKTEKILTTLFMCLIYGLEELFSGLGKLFSSLFRFIADNIRSILIGIAVILAVVGLVFLLSPKYHEVTIQGFSWERNINIEKLTTVKESDWSTPIGARVYDTKEEFYTYEDVYDHTETKTRTVQRTRYVGEEEYVTGYRDLGNGYFEEITSSKPIYETYDEVETYEEDVYRKEPVYKTKYYYEIDKWLYHRKITTKNNDKEPFWGEVILAKKERTGNKYESYYIHVLQLDEKTEELKEIVYPISYNQWSDLQVGENVKIKVFLGFAEVVYEE